MIHKGKILLKKSAGVALMILLAGASVAAAALTFTGTAMTGDAGTTIDVGSGNTLSIQTTANGPVTFGTGLITFTSASGTNLGLNAVSSSYVSSTYISASTTLTVGDGKPISKISCTTTSRTLGAIAVAATTSIPFSLAGISTSSNQVYYFGHNTSSAGVANLAVLGYIPSSTPNGMDVTLLNPTSTGPAFAARTSATTFSLCYMQF